MLANWNLFKPRRIDFFFSPKTVTTRCNETVSVGDFRHSLLQQVPCISPMFRNFLAESTSVSRHWRAGEEEACFLEIIGVPDRIWTRVTAVKGKIDALAQ